MLNQFKELWQSLGSNQKISLVLAGGLVVLAMIGMMVWAAKPDMQLLYGGLPPDEAGKIVSNLEKKGVAFELGKGGNSIYVPAADLYKVKVALASEGIPSGSGPGFELFDEGSFGISDFVQRTNFLRAVQGELSRTISQFDGVKSARVMVVMPENRSILSREGADRPTASVFVEAGSLPLSTVNSIRNLVANAIQRLSVNDVVVVDSSGNVLSEELRSDGIGGGMSNDIIRYRKSLETYFTGKVQTMLDRVLGANQSEVRVAVDIDTTSVQTTETLFDPDSQVARSLTTKEDSQVERESSADNGGAGVASNVPDGGPGIDNAYNALKERENRNKTKTESFEINERVVSSVRNPGAIKRLTASLLIAQRYEAGPSGEAQPVRRSDEDLAEIRQIVVNALGILPQAGETPADYVTVKEIAFAANPFQDHGALLEKEATYQRWIETGKNVAGVVLGFGVIIFFLQMLKRHKPEKISIEVLQPEQMLQSRRIEDTSVVTPEMLNELIRQKPANIGVSLRQWIGEGEAIKK